MLRTLRDTLKVTQCLEPATVSATGAGAGVDNAIGGSLAFIVNVGDFAFTGGNKLDIVMQDSDVDVDGSYAACVAADFYSDDNPETAASGIFKSLDATGDVDSVYVVHYKGNKRYARINLVETGTVSAPVSIVAVQGHLKSNPA